MSGDDRQNSPSISRQNRPSATIGVIIWTAVKLRGSDSYTLLGAIGSMLALLFYVVLYNRMMVYVENHAYQNPNNEEMNKK